MNILEMMIGQKLFGGSSGSSSGGGGQIPVDTGSFVLASDSYQPDSIQVGINWDHMLIWTENSSLIGRRNISGAVLWVNPNDNLAYKVFYTNSSGTSGVTSELLSGGVLYEKNNRTLSFGLDISYGVYAANTTYKWIAWKEGE